jgi:hypothetical protein
MTAVRLSKFSTCDCFFRTLAAGGLAAAILLAAAPARAITVPLPNSFFESLSGSMGLEGNVALAGDVSFLGILNLHYPAQSPPLSLPSPTKFNTQPETSTALVADLVNGSLVTFTNFDLDLLHGSTVDLPALVSPISGTINGTAFVDDSPLQLPIIGMTFTQTGAPSVFPIPGDGSRDFTVPGMLQLEFGPSEIIFSGIFGVAFGGTTANVPVTLTGTFDTIGSLVQVSGTGSADVPFAVLETTLIGDPDELEVNFTAGIHGTAHVEFDYAFTLYNIIPEPASVVLLGIGLTSLALVAARRRR